MSILLTHIKQQLSEALPGKKAQFEMANLQRAVNYVVPDDAREAGVMLLLHPSEREYAITFIQRTSKNINDPHSGQISFPGGKFEVSDNSMLDCALRETHEEIGVFPEQINVLGALSPLYIPVSNFNVFPFVGYVAAQSTYTLQTSEVVNILTAPISHFLNPTNRAIEDLKLNAYSLPQVPFFKLEDKKIWGATAMILNEFLTIARPAINI